MNKDSNKKAPQQPQQKWQQQQPSQKQQPGQKTQLPGQQDKNRR